MIVPRQALIPDGSTSTRLAQCGHYSEVGPVARVCAPAERVRATETSSRRSSPVARAQRPP
jgi:hypothetical protein